MTQPTTDAQAARDSGPDDSTDGAAPNGSKTNGVAEPKPDIPDPFDPEAYRAPPEGEPGSGVEAQPIKLKVRKPKKGEFLRCHPTLRLKAWILEKEDGFDKLYYLVQPPVAVMNASEFKQVELCLCINRDGTLFVWPIQQPGESGKTNEWGVSARSGAHQALTRWVRLKSDMANGQYVVLVAPAHIPDPVWPPTMTLRDMLARAFGEGGIIGDEDHPEMKALRGE